MHSPRDHTRSFGVLEIILSVAILAAFSVFVLRLFVSASDNESKMRLLDRADTAAVSYIEQFKGGSTPFALSAALGGSPSGGAYRRVFDLPDGIRARVDIAKDGTAGLYQISVRMTRARDGAGLLSLSGLQYFGSEAGEAGG
jgi:hypothetical protein